MSELVQALYKVTVPLLRETAELSCQGAYPGRKSLKALFLTQLKSEKNKEKDSAMGLTLPCNYGIKIGMWFSPTTQGMIKDIIPSTYLGSGQGRIMGKFFLLLARPLPQQWLHLQPLAPAWEAEPQPQVHPARTGLHPACSGPAAYGPAQPSAQPEPTPC